MLVEEVHHGVLKDIVDGAGLGLKSVLVKEVHHGALKDLVDGTDLG
jgi:hypothetical protein